MSIIRFENVSLAYGHRPLLDNVTFAIEEGQKICLLGRNGEGKSSLMSLLMKSSDPDSGVINFQKGLKVGALPQSMPDADERNVFDVVAEGLPEIGQVLSEYHHLINSQDEAADLQKLEKLQDRIESLNGWDFDTRIASMLKRFGLHESMQMKDLSGGWRRRVMLARALINEPDLLLLDEPTNHLDIETIKWLEARLAEYRGALLFVSHDRAFIKALASNIIELDRGNITAFNGGYSDYLKEKQRLLEEEERQNALFDKRLSEEEVWIRQGIKARRTRNEGRVRALKAMRDERKQRVNQQGKAEIKIAEAEKSGKLVAEAEHVSLAFDSGRKVIDDFSLTVMRGDRIGLIGANGAGKTTLLKVLLDQLKPTSGSVRLGSKLEVAYFDQLRGGLDFTKTVFDNVADGHDFVEMDGKSRHVMSYLNDFLFTAERARSPITALSGGETNRLLLARLFAKPANVIVMDEPTNDLDVDTLELLEERLAQFQGTLLITSHDRDFIDQVVTSTLVFEGEGKIGEYVGGYNDWVRQTGGRLPTEGQYTNDKDNAAKPLEKELVPTSSSTEKQSPAVSQNKPKKLSYKLKLELEQLPAKIEKMESRIEELQALIVSPEFYQKDHEEIESVTAELAALEDELSLAMERWMELEDA
ncbi:MULTISPECIES: ATP-binding cassette domain-containing protein [unclassified Oleiphilus]|uniref:ATP-binding cassette domain-containing protein n=9 Tax=Oleiphilus TaxID=141450 RepID=UPI0007C2CD4A|nr:MULTISPECIES: ATP-binding cassette domain-containing protein [unclassified Oleiphilus]KZY72380.1 ABC transporter ATP-binding protein [Oleiphilus sp. HI0068]KZY83877.1 ABC transporter ATP-binding protein [Oleiphilus sp. HI0069]KZZ11950.1 ABC transporter ATP-binding protein [Oleiphilus sp. HI0078]KZZ46266.1 ABC transporter ATP-binding protein [Oleiphilus sp. HI0085]KZY33938.1 ABC transporter ATP-binding protein [Oleiphilus sp. HI0043]